MASRTGRILLAVDGEPHTDEAVRWALDLARGLGVELALVHIRDPYLKQFSTEIYAQGREEYLEHVQLCLEEKADQARTAFEASIDEFLGKRNDEIKPRWTFAVLDGDPLEQLAACIESGAYSMVVLGKRYRKGIAAFRYRDLADRLSSTGCPIPVLVVPERDRG